MSEENPIIHSKVILERLEKITNGVDYNDYFRPEYSKLIKTGLDIADVDHFPVAVGVLGKALEKQIAEFVQNGLKNKRQFQVNSHDHGIAKIKKKFGSSSHYNRVNLLHGDEVSFSKKNNDGTTTTYKYKLHGRHKMLKDSDYHELINIKNARNDVFHDCSEERENEIEAMAHTYFERGIMILAKLEKLNTSM